MSDQGGRNGWRGAYDEARRLWPSVELPFEAFLQHAEETGRAVPETVTWAAEVYLAFACGAGDRAALAILETSYLVQARAALFRLDARAELIDDVLQELRTKLLVGASPRIMNYAGRGPLAAWLRVAATRTAIDLFRANKPALGAEDLAGDTFGQIDLGPEVQMLREAYRDAFKQALAEALRELSPKDRNLLRRHLVDNLTLEEIAAPYGVHPATIARRLATLREDIAESVRRQLAERHRDAGGSTSLESVARAIRSEVAISMATLLVSVPTLAEENVPSRPDRP